MFLKLVTSNALCVMIIILILAVVYWQWIRLQIKFNECVDIPFHKIWATEHTAEIIVLILALLFHFSNSLR